MTALPLDPPRYPFYRFEFAIERLHDDRAQDAAVACLLAGVRRWWHRWR